ncbi:hypothetical protein KSP39_PZI003290 [Platanthera zijinensis]|uniref:Uncharacterized protein n=1 Tax=Platanthera zijinensis TaxID=2320716 RepID=A0AAP0BW79_9ASPA
MQGSAVLRHPSPEPHRLEYIIYYIIHTNIIIVNRSSFCSKQLLRPSLAGARLRSLSPDQDTVVPRRSCWKRADSPWTPWKRRLRYAPPFSAVPRRSTAPVAIAVARLCLLVAPAL